MAVCAVAAGACGFWLFCAGALACTGLAAGACVVWGGRGAVRRGRAGALSSRFCVVAGRAGVSGLLRLSSACALVVIWACAVPASSNPAAQSRERRHERESIFFITVQTSPEGGRDKTGYAGIARQKCAHSCRKLLFGNTFGECLPRIKQQGYGQVAVLAHLYGGNVAHFYRIGHGGYGPFFRFHNRKADMRG